MVRMNKLHPPIDTGCYRKSAYGDREPVMIEPFRTKTHGEGKIRYRLVSRSWYYSVTFPTKKEAQHFAALKFKD